MFNLNGDDMEEYIKLILNYGGTVAMAVLFIIVFLGDRKDRKETENKEDERKKEEKEERRLEREANNKLLGELSASNRNIAESLNLLKTSIDTNTTEFRQHDERSIKEFGKINEHFIKIEEHIKQ